MRVTPKIWIGFAVVVGYLAVIVAVQAASGIPYTELGDSAGNLFVSAGLSLIIGAVLLAVLLTVFRWWGPVLRDQHRSKHRWPIIAPILLAVIAVINLLSSDWNAVSGAFVAAALVLVLVGFTEEVVARGILLVTLRTRVSEVWVWLLTSVVFAVMHMVNSVLGQPLAASVQQAGFAFIVGSILYVFRRTTGSLIPAMALHGLWDFAVFIEGNGTPGPGADLSQVLFTPVAILGIVTAVLVSRGTRERLEPTAARAL